MIIFFYPNSLLQIQQLIYTTYNIDAASPCLLFSKFPSPPGVQTSYMNAPTGIINDAPVVVLYTLLYASL